MDKYKEFISCQRTLQTDINYWESRGYELVSHAVCSTNTISLLFKRINKASVSKPIADAAVKDNSFDLIVLSALRHTLPRHSHVQYTVRDYILKYWTRLQNKHWAILSDIREYIFDTVKWYVESNESQSHMDKINLNEWVRFYNTLLTMEDTCLDSNFQHLKDPIFLNSKNEPNPN